MGKALSASIAMISCSLAALIVSSPAMVNFVQSDVRQAAIRHAPGVHILCELYVHEAGWARLTLGIIGLLIVAFPFRRRELWSWLALAVLLGVYLLPGFVIKHAFYGWSTVVDGIRHDGLQRIVLLNYLFSALMLIGLVLSLPTFLRERPLFGRHPD